MAKKILILEDEVDVAQLYAKRLSTNGYEAEFVHNGLQGLEKLKTFTPDLILLDLNMPEMGGLEFYQRLCGSSDKPQYPVLVLTARADLETLFRDFNADGFIPKPFDGSRLLKEVAIILNKQYKKKTDGKIRRVIVVDDNKESLGDVVQVFANAGYTTETSDSGVGGVEKIMANPPDLALINLGIKDISGDLVILRLQNMAKTRNVDYILYSPRINNDLDGTVMAKMAVKSGVKRLCQYAAPSELLEIAIKVFKEEED